MKAGQWMVVFLHALIGWALCAATMGIGMTLTTMQKILVIHAIGAPIYFALVSLVYFSRYNWTSPLRTAVIFTGFVMAVDFLVVALLINKSLAMFSSLLGTWIPFGLIFVSTFATGLVIRSRTK